MYRLLLQSHQASQQSNFGRLREQPGLPAPEAKAHLRILDVSILPHLPGFQVIEVEALSIGKYLDHQSGVDRCGTENSVLRRKPRFRGRRV